MRESGVMASDIYSEGDEKLLQGFPLISNFNTVKCKTSSILVLVVAGFCIM